MSAKLINRKTFKSNLLTVSVVAFIVLTVLCITFAANGYASRRSYQTDPSQYDLSGCDLDNGRGVYLNGSWDYYKDRLVSSVPNKDRGGITASVIIPSANSKVLDGNYPVDHAGVSSYVCTVKNISARDYLTVYIPGCHCAYNVYINGDLVTSSGVVTENMEQIWTTPTRESSPFLLEAGKTYEIMIEVASENNAVINMPVKLVNFTRDAVSRSRVAAARFILCGIIISFAFIFIILKRFVNRDLYSLWLPVLSFVLLVRILMASDSFSVLQSILFNVSYEDTNIFTFVATYIIKLVSLVYITKCLKINTADNVFVAFSALFLALAVIIGFLPDSLFDVYFYMILQLLSSVIDIFIINKLCVEITKKTEYAVLYLLSYVFAILGVLIDILYSNGIIHSDFSLFMPVCFLLFVAFTAGIHTRRIRKVFDYAIEAQRLETELERANNAIMLSQIQPHFMFNALNTIKSLIKRDPPKAEKAVIDFSMYIRGNMDSLSKTDPIPFSEELDHIKYYCNIEQLRFRDKLDVFYEIGPDDFYVPTLSVQPIVENAIKHGVTKRPEGGSVTITTEEDEENYYITVEDDGVGFDIRRIDEPEDKSRSHVGIKNIKDRFEIIMNAQVSIESHIGKGSKITVRLPKETNFKTLQESLEYNRSEKKIKEMEI